jgi:hypothetical protein
VVRIQLVGRDPSEASAVLIDDEDRVELIRTGAVRLECRHWPSGDHAGVRPWPGIGSRLRSSPVLLTSQIEFLV